MKTLLLLMGLSLGCLTMACQNNDSLLDRAEEGLEEIEDEAGDAKDEIKDEVDDSL